MPWSVPNVRISGVPIVAQGFNWSLSAGTTPYQTSILVPNALQDQIAALENPVSVALEVTGGTTGEPDPHTIQFDQIYLQQPRRIDPYNWMWDLADARFSWRGKKIFAAYNVTRQSNSKSVFGTAPDDDPASLRQPFDTFPVGRYLPWSVRNGKPWTMREIVEDQFQQLGINYTPADGDDQSYILENVIYEGVDIYSGLADMCAKSRLSIGINREGSVYAYSVDFYDESQIDLLIATQNTLKTAPSLIYQQEMSRIRPAKVRVMFERLQEVRVIGVDVTVGQDTQTQPLVVPLREKVVTEEDRVQRRAVGAINVIPIPYPITIAGIERQIGELVPFVDYLNAIGFSESDLRTYWFSDQLERRLTILFSAGGTTTLSIDALAGMIAGKLRSNYRQTWMIDPFMMARIKNWITRRCGVVDNYAKYSPPSPLWADYCIVPARRNPYTAKRSGLWTTHPYNWVVNDEDPYRENGTAGTVSTVNQDLGVFRVSFPGLIDRTIDAIKPTKIENLPTGIVGQSNSLWSQAYLAATHTMETVLSVVWHLDYDDQYKSPRKYLVWEFDYAAKNGKGPEIEYLSRLEYARHGLRKPNDEVYSVGEDVENIGVLNAVAKAEAGKLINQYRDRKVGAITTAGWVEFRVDGNVKSVTYSFTPGRGAETRIDARDIPPAQTIEQAVDPDTLAFLKRQVSQAKIGTQSG